MTHAIAHRGPDDEGYVFFDSRKRTFWQYGGEVTPGSVYRSDFVYTPKHAYTLQDHDQATIAFGHRRLSIIDLSPSGHQPMCTPDMRYWIIYNGEIYNYVELRNELKNFGYKFQSNSDTEVLLYAYIHWGEKALNRLIGMFAFAIYDREENKLFLARDFFGIKPLYYTVWDDGFAFSSEIKALLCLPHVSRKVNPQRVYDYLRFGHTDHGQETMFSDILQIPAAHYMTISLDNQKEDPGLCRYWDILPWESPDISFKDAAQELRRLFLRNIELHLRSDVPVGSALSGGIDSSSIVMAIRRLQGKNQELHTFSYIPKDPQLSEEKWVNIIGKASGALIHKTRPSSRELIADLETLISIQDEPFASSSIYAQYRVMRLASENGIKVMLDGQGADELLGGYPCHWGARLASMIHELRFLKAWRFYLKIACHGNESWKTPLLRAGSYFLPFQLKPLAYKTAQRNLSPRWLKTDWFKKRGVRFFINNGKRTGKILQEELLRSLLHVGLISLLRYEDRNAMAFSIESRVPFLTPELGVFILSLPEEYIVDLNGKSKSVFREAMRGIVPDEILNRRDKVGFTTSEQSWLLSIKSQVKSILHSPNANDIPTLDIHFLKKEWTKLTERSQPTNFTAWRCINFIKWCELKEVRFF